MNKNILIILLIVLFVRCEKKEIPISEVFSKLEVNPGSSIGDGTRIISIICEVNPDADGTQDFILKTSMGIFTENKDTKIVKKPEFKDGKFVIETFAQVPITSGNMIISAEPNQPLEKRDFIISDTVKIIKSLPASIRLSTSALGLGSNFYSEVQLIGTLLNDKGGKVSTGTKVRFEMDKAGRFRDMLTTSDNNSKVSAYFGAGNYQIGTDIKITAIILDSLGNDTDMKDSIILTINQ